MDENDFDNRYDFGSADFDEIPDFIDGANPADRDPDDVPLTARSSSRPWNTAARREGPRRGGLRTAAQRRQQQQQQQQQYGRVQEHEDEAPAGTAELEPPVVHNNQVTVSPEPSPRKQANNVSTDTCSTSDDDEDYDIENRSHDQLPSAEELKTMIAARKKLQNHKPLKGGGSSASYSSLQGGARRTNSYRMYVWIAIALVVAIVFFIVGMVLGKSYQGQQQQQGTATAFPPSAVSPSINPQDTAAAVDAAGAASPDNDNDVEEATPEEARLMDVLVGVLNFGYIGDRTTPQYLASQWLANYDPMALPVDIQSLDFRQRYALAVLFFSLQGREWLYPMKWLSGLDVCQWNAQFRQEEDDKHIKLGVDCDCAPGEKKCNPQTVKRILLDGMGLRGSIPPQIELLDNLVELSMYKNRVQGSLPEQITNLSHLQVLDLHNNEISGMIPANVGNWKSLQMLNMANNNITGTFPSSMSRLTSLQVLNLNNNHVTGPLSPALQGMTSIQALFLQQNDLTGTFTKVLLDSWKHVQVLDVSNNNLQETLPTNLFQHDSLTVLDLHGNSFTGALPTQASASAPLTMVTLHGNTVSGPIPSALGQLKVLEHLDLSNSMYTGIIPEELSQLSYLKYLSLAFNPSLADAPVPSWISKLTSLVTLSLQQTSRTGFLPHVWDPLDRMLTLDLADNRLLGAIPPDLSNMNVLERLLLHDNTLTGQLPQTLVQLDLHTFTIQQNEIQGNAEIVCQPKLPRLTNFYSDCVPTQADGTPASMSSSIEFECSCCSVCCNGNDNSAAECTTNIDTEDVFYGGDSNPAWDNTYVKDHFRFHDSESLHPLDLNDATQPGTFPLDEFSYLENGALASTPMYADAATNSGAVRRVLVSS